MLGRCGQAPFVSAEQLLRTSVILISINDFEPAYLQRDMTPVLSELAAEAMRLFPFDCNFQPLQPGYGFVNQSSGVPAMQAYARMRVWRRCYVGWTSRCILGVVSLVDAGWLIFQYKVAIIKRTAVRTATLV